LHRRYHELRAHGAGRRVGSRCRRIRGGLLLLIIIMPGAKIKGNSRRAGKNAAPESARRGARIMYFAW